MATRRVIGVALLGVSIGRAILGGLMLSDNEEPIAVVEESSSNLGICTGVVRDKVRPNKKTKTLKDIGDSGMN